MGNTIGVIVGMLGLTIGSSIGQGVLIADGKITEAKYVDLTTKSAIIVTTLVYFVDALKSIGGLA